MASGFDSTGEHSSSSSKFYGLFGNEKNSDSSDDEMVAQPTNAVNVHQSDVNDVTKPDGDFWKDFSPKLIEQQTEAIGMETKSVPTATKHYRSHSKPADICRLHVGYRGKRKLSSDTDLNKTSLLRHCPIKKPAKSQDFSKLFLTTDLIYGFISRPQSRTILPKHARTLDKRYVGTLSRLKWCRKEETSHLLASCGVNKSVTLYNLHKDDRGDYKLRFSLHHQSHQKLVRDVEWSYSGRELISCGYDSTCCYYDIATDTVSQRYSCPSFATVVKQHPSNSNLFLAGLRNAIVCFDKRMPRPVRTFQYKTNFDQVLDLCFLPKHDQFLSSSSVVSRESSDRTIMAWDLNSGACISNQIFQERYAVTRMMVHPNNGNVLAQTQGDYIAIFDSKSPWKLKKSRRYQGHHVREYAIGFDISKDGRYVCSCDSDGNLLFYDCASTKLLRTITCGKAPVMDCNWHPVIPNFVAACDWDGHIFIVR